MVEGSGFENRRTGNGTRGSNPFSSAEREPAPPPYDFAVVGSGFGGSVAALRLAEKGYRVVVLEQGERLDQARALRAGTELREFVWEPRLRMFGYFAQHVFRHVGVIGGVGVGGGSLVFGGVLLRPKQAFFRDPAWSDLGIDWEGELSPHYETAARMLGLAVTPRLGVMDEYLRRTAEAMGAAETFGPTPNAIHFGLPGETHPDPYFGGEGPARAGCRLCGRCLTGCPYGAKNSLDQNYLYLAEKRGAVLHPRHQVVRLEGRAGGGYRLEVVDPKTRRRREPVDARRVVLAAGVIGTLDLLLRSRDVHRTLPALSPRLGRQVRTNSEAIVGVTHPAAPPDLTEGASISSHFYVGERTHITQNRFGPSFEVMRFYATPMVDDGRPLRRALRTVLALLRHPVRSTLPFRTRDWHRKVTQLTVMQDVESTLSFELGRPWFWPFTRSLRSSVAGGRRPPSYLPEANRAARLLAQAAGGEPFNLAPESLGNLSITAHILGGCPMGRTSGGGVIDTSHEVHSYPGLYVLDGAAVPANVGVNPSLTITAMAERAMSLIPPSRS